MTREDKDAIIRRLEAMYGEAEDNETKEALFYAIEALKKQRPHGEWIYKDMKGQFCSVCDKQSVWKFNFCPNCGASMRKEGEQ